jgi:hypothetical protein
VGTSLKLTLAVELISARTSWGKIKLKTAQDLFDEL